MKDRLVAGGLAGIIAGIIQYGYGMAALRLGITDRIFGQFSDIIFGGLVYSGIRIEERYGLNQRLSVEPPSLSSCR